MSKHEFNPHPQKAEIMAAIREGAENQDLTTVFKVSSRTLSRYRCELFGKKPRSMSTRDAVFVTKKMELFVELIRDTKGFLLKHMTGTLANSPDGQLETAALWIVGDSYLRGKGIVAAFSGEKGEAYLERLGVLLKGVQDETLLRPYLYPYLKGVMDRAMAATELDMMTHHFGEYLSADEPKEEE